MDGDLVERVAAAICDARFWPGAWIKATEPEMNDFRHQARAALAVAEPAVREACARVAGALLADNLTDSRNPVNVVREIAAAIRSGARGGA